MTRHWTAWYQIRGREGQIYHRRDNVTHKTGWYLLTALCVIGAIAVLVLTFLFAAWMLQPGPLA